MDDNTETRMIHGFKKGVSMIPKLVRRLRAIDDELSLLNDDLTAAIGWEEDNVELLTCLYDFNGEAAEALFFEYAKKHDNLVNGPKKKKRALLKLTADERELLGLSESE